MLKDGIDDVADWLARFHGRSLARAVMS